MKKQISFIFLFFLIGIFLGAVIVSSSYFSIKNKLIFEMNNHLEEITAKDAEQINYYLSEMETDLQFLQESEEVKDLLKQNLIFDKSVVERYVSKRAEVIEKEIENYLRTYPEMTLKDLQDNYIFKKIAVQPIGKEGYSALFECNTLIIRFHKDPNLIDFDLNDLRNSNPSFVNEISKLAQGEQRIDQFYNWEESNGEIRKKYGDFRKISVKTAEGIELCLGVTAYIDNFKMINVSEIDEDWFRRVMKNPDYNKVILISKDGYVSYMNEPEPYLGTNLEWFSNANKGLANNYFEVKKDQKPEFYGPFIEAYGEIYPEISIIAPVYEGEVLLGYVGITDNMKNIFDMLSYVDHDHETEEYYLINKDQLLITKLRNANFDIMVQYIDTKNAENCMGDFDDLYEMNLSGVFEFLNYRGELSFGKHFPLSKTHWCLLVEIEQNEGVKVPLKNAIAKETPFIIFGIIVFSLIGFFVGRYFDNNPRKQRKSLKKSRFMLGGEKVFKKLKLRYLFLMSVLFSLLYFFVLKLFFKGIVNTNFYDLVPDSLALITFTFLLLYSFKLKNIFAGKMVFMGAFLSVIDRMIQMILEEYIFHNEVISALWWIPGALLGFAGIILILIGFREVIE